MTEKVHPMRTPRAATSTRPLVIAHRGASGYLPEHTLAAKALAHFQGADFLEQDVVLTSDGIPIVVHDIYLDRVSDVRRTFPKRCRADGKYYAIDFTWAEIRGLRVHERLAVDREKPAYPGRFPAASAVFGISSLEDEFELIEGLNHTLQRQVGVYCEIKRPAWHRHQGQDATVAVLACLRRLRTRSPTIPVFVQCFDPEELRRLDQGLDCEFPLVQLVGENAWNEADTDFARMRTLEGLREIASYADAIGPWIPHLTGTDSKTACDANSCDLTRAAHAEGLQVHAYTLRKDALPLSLPDLEAAHRFLFEQARVDAVFTDFPDLTRQFLDRV